MKRKILVLMLMIAICMPLFAKSNKEYNEFINIVKKELKNINIKNYEDHFSEEYFIIKDENDYFEVGTEVGLSNLYSICLQNNKSEWKNIVKNHFAYIKQTKADEKLINPKLEKFETGKEFLKIRIYSSELKDEYSKSSIIDFFNDDFIGVVVIEYPSAIKSLPKEYVGKWSLTEKQIIDYAVKNTLKNNKESFENYKISDTFDISILLSDSNIFITSSIYDLKINSEYGSFVAIPNRYGILVKNINKKSINNDIVQMLDLVDYIYQQGPGSITNTVFWYDGKKYYKIIHDKSKGMVKLPDELVKLLK